MTQVKLMGELGNKFGTDWTSGHKSMREILKLIDCQVEGFKEYIAECHDNNIQFTVQNGKEFMDDSLDELTLNNLKDTVIITPVPAGSGKGLGKLITGLLMLAALFFMPGMGAAFTSGGTAGATAGSFLSSSTVISGGVGTVTLSTGTSVAAAIASGATLTTGGMMVAMLGVNLAMMGLTEMSMPDAGDMESDPSFLFNGANNNIEQGQPVPLLYGTMKIGGTPLSQGFKSGELKGTHFNLADSSATSTTYYGSSSTGTNAVGRGGHNGLGSFMQK